MLLAVNLILPQSDTLPKANSKRISTAIISDTEASKRLEVLYSMTQISSKDSLSIQGSLQPGALHLSSPFSPPSQPMSRPERQAAGQALRQTVPRSLHREWQPSQARQDPIALIELNSPTRGGGQS